MKTFPKLIAAAVIVIALAAQCGNNMDKTTTPNNMKNVDISVLGAEDPFELIGQEWMLVTAGTKDSFNTMTASWGGLGILWNKKVATIYVRPSRYTHDFIEKNDHVTLSFYTEEYRKALQICGTKSGRDCDKVAEAGLTPVELESGAMTFSQARLSLECRKLFKTEMAEDNFIDKSIYGNWYGDADEGSPHTIYILEIENIFAVE